MRCKIVIYATRCNIEKYIVPLLLYVRSLLSLVNWKRFFFQDCTRATAKWGRETKFAVAPVKSWKNFRFQFTKVSALRTYKKIRMTYFLNRNVFFIILFTRHIRILLSRTLLIVKYVDFINILSFATVYSYLLHLKVILILFTTLIFLHLTYLCTNYFFYLCITRDWLDSISAYLHDFLLTIAHSFLTINRIRLV